MAFIIPKITYPAAAPVTTLNFTYPPVDKPGIDDLAAVRTDSLTLSGLKQSMWLRNDVFKHVSMQNVPMSDLANWLLFIDYALQGGSFLYYPDATDTGVYAEWVLEESGGSAPSSGNVADTWSPTYSARGIAQFDLTFRKVIGGISVGVPDIPSSDIVSVGDVPTPPGGVVTVTPPPGVPPVPPGGGATEDMLDWVIMATGIGGQPDRATQHLRGVNQSGETTLYYPYLDTSTSVHKVWQIKALTGSGVGNPADVLPFDSVAFYHWITEIASRWSDPHAFKRINRAASSYPTAEGVPVMPRNFAPGAVGSPAAVTINSPKPNPQNDFIACVSQPAIELGDFQGVTHGLYSINFGGDVGTKDTIINTVYRGNFGSFKVRENFYYVKYWGFVKWESQSLIGGVWTTTNSSIHNLLISGGGLTPNFPCGMAYGWWL